MRYINFNLKEEKLRIEIRVEIYNRRREKKKGVGREKEIVGSCKGVGDLKVGNVGYGFFIEIIGNNN